MPNTTVFRPMFSFLRVQNWQSLSRGAVVSFGLRVAGSGLLYVLHVLLARWLGTQGYGIYAFAISWTTFLAEMGTLGLPNAALRFVPEYRTGDEPGLLRGFLRASRGLVVGGAVVLAALASGVALLLPAGEIPTATLLTGFWLAPLLALILFETEVLRATSRFALSYGPVHVLRPLGTGLAAGAILGVTGSLSPLQVLLCMGGVFVLAIAIQQWGTRQSLSPAFDVAPTRKTRRWLTVALPLLLTGGFQLVLRKTDVFLVGTLVGAAEVGIYFAAMRTAQVITFFSFAADAVAAPYVSRLYHSDGENLPQAVGRLAHWYFWPTLFGAAGLAFVAEPVLSLFGPTFVSGAPIVYVFMAGLVFDAAMGAQQHLLTLTGHERACASIYGYCALLNVALNLAGIYWFGALGAAVATAATLVIRGLWVRRRVIELVGLHPSIVSHLTGTRASSARSVSDESN